MCKNDTDSPFAAPRGAPTFTYARNLSSTSVEVGWEPPPRDTINGEFTAYLLSYWRLQSGRRAGIVRELLLRDDKRKVSRGCLRESRYRRGAKETVS